MHTASYIPYFILYSGMCPGISTLVDNAFRFCFSVELFLQNDEINSSIIRLASFFILEVIGHLQRVSPILITHAYITQIGKLDDTGMAHVFFYLVCVLGNPGSDLCSRCLHFDEFIERVDELFASRINIWKHVVVSSI